MNSNEWEPTIGIEVHVQLNTKFKLFSPVPNQHTAVPNTNIDAYDLAIPGTLPVLNREALRKAIQFGLAIDAEINPVVQFDRKSFFYPDLPKGYQICQHHNPLMINGKIKVQSESVGLIDVDITQAHIEEDVGKSCHGIDASFTGIDHNRVGTPLLEIVSAPCIHSAFVAAECFREIHRLVTWLGICEGKLHEGSLRCDANISINKTTDTHLGTPVEIKNINSFRFLREALDFEISRQIEILSQGKNIQRETRSYNSVNKTTYAMRTKEKIQDYRYISEPDLPAIQVSADVIEYLKDTLPELPVQRCQRFIKEYELSQEVATQLTQTRKLSSFFEEVAANLQNYGHVARWFLNDLRSFLKRKEIKLEELPTSAVELALLVDGIQTGTISRSQTLVVIEYMYDHKVDLDQTINILGAILSQDSSKIYDWVSQVAEAHPKVLTQYLDGNDKLLDFLIGQVSKVSAGRAHPQAVKQCLQDRWAAKGES